MNHRKDRPAGKAAFWKRLRVRAFHFYFLISRPMTLGVRAVILDRENRSVLLLRHTYVDGWHLPGGGVDPGESMVDALRRELIEEVNVEITKAPVLLSVHFNNRISRRDHVALYLVDGFRKKGPFKPNHEIAEARFFPTDDLPPDVSPSSARRIDEVVGGASVSPYW